MCVVKYDKESDMNITGFPASAPDVSARLCALIGFGETFRVMFSAENGTADDILVAHIASHVDLLSMSRVSSVAWQCQFLFC